MRRRMKVVCLAALATAALWSERTRADVADVEVTALIEELTDGADPLARANAAAELGELGPATAGMVGKAIPALIEALGFDLEYPVRGQAAGSLGRLGPLSGEVVPALTEALRWDTHLMVRWRTAEALQRIATQHPRTADVIVPALLAALQGDPYPGVRARAAQALGLVDPGEIPVVPALVDAFQQDSHPGVRWQAAAALEHVALYYYRNHVTTAPVAELKAAQAVLTKHPHPEIQLNAEGLRKAIRQIDVEQSSRSPN